MPKALWERFDLACEKAYAPAARHFAEQAAARKQVRKQREEFIAAAAAHAPTLLTEPRDWRAIERWLREMDHKWRDGDLGSVEPKAWKGFDTQFRAALAPARDALAAARERSKSPTCRIDRGGDGAFQESDGARYAVEGESDPVSLAGAGEGTVARAA